MYCVAMRQDVCHGDGSSLDHVPANSVDHVISNAAVYHLEMEVQCTLMLEHFLRIVRPGGSIWIGWSGAWGEQDDTEYLWERDWEVCLKKAPSSARILYGFAKEEVMFGKNE